MRYEAPYVRISEASAAHLPWDDSMAVAFFFAEAFCHFTTFGASLVTADVSGLPGVLGPEPTIKLCFCCFVTTLRHHELTPPTHPTRATSAAVANRTSSSTLPSFDPTRPCWSWRASSRPQGAAGRARHVNPPPPPSPADAVSLD